jgi:hypothetical protein
MKKYWRVLCSGFEEVPMLLFLQYIFTAWKLGNATAHQRRSAGSYFDQELFIFVKKFEFYLVTQSL